MIKNMQQAWEIPAKEYFLILSAAEYGFLKK